MSESYVSFICCGAIVLIGTLLLPSESLTAQSRSPLPPAAPGVQQPSLPGQAGSDLSQASGDDVSSLTLQEAYKTLHQTHPIAQKADIEREITHFKQRLARSGLFPELSIGAGASYQSDVTEFPFTTPSEASGFSRDHYHLSLELNQSLFDGGRSSALRKSKQIAGDVAQAGIQVDLLTLRSQLEQVWFGILMMQKQREVRQLTVQEIDERLAQVDVMVQNGVLLPGDNHILQAERIQIQQGLTQIDADLRVGYRVLETILGVDLPEGIPLKLPDLSAGSMPTRSLEVRRPEYELLDAQKSQLNAQKDVLSADKLPSFSLFGRTYYGRPGLNVFDDDLQFNWVAGIRAQWSLRGTRNASLRQEVMDLQTRTIDVERDVFTRQLQAQRARMEEEMEALRLQIDQDEEVVELRVRVTAEKQALLEQGALTSTDYVTELLAEQRARLDLEIRKIQLAQIMTEYRTKHGWF